MVLEDGSTLDDRWGDICGVIVVSKDGHFERMMEDWCKWGHNHPKIRWITVERLDKFIGSAY